MRLHDDRWDFAHDHYSLLERQRSTLETTLTKLHLEHPDLARVIQSEAEAREKCSEAREQLHKYEAIYGPAALLDAGPDVHALTEQLRFKDDELRKTRLELKALQEVCSISMHLSVNTHRLCRSPQPYILK